MCFEQHDHQEVHHSRWLLFFLIRIFTHFNKKIQLLNHFLWQIVLIYDIFSAFSEIEEEKC